MLFPWSEVSVRALGIEKIWVVSASPEWSLTCVANSDIVVHGRKKRKKIDNIMQLSDIVVLQCDYVSTGHGGKKSKEIDNIMLLYTKKKLE